MANDDKEIEIKLRVDENTFRSVKEKLEKIADFVKSSRQVDDYFMPVHRDFLQPKFPFEWLSIRKRGGKVILNYKHWHPENTEVTTHCDEFETEIKNPEKLHKIFDALNFKKLITVDKEREVYVSNNEFEIALDKVMELGHFIEIEAIKDFGSVDAAREKLFEFAKKLGLDTSNPDLRGYPFLLLEKRGLIRR